MRSNRVIAIGCFYKVEVPGDENEDDREERVLIGVIFSKIEQENNRNQGTLSYIDAPRWNNQSWFDRAREFFSCGNLILS